jgi:hypothetical protein
MEKTMFSYRLLEGHAGLLLIGNVDSLMHLNEIVWDVCNRSSFLNGDLPALPTMCGRLMKENERSFLHHMTSLNTESTTG